MPRVMLVCTVLACAVAGPAFADEWILADGQKVVGKFLREENDRVYVELRFGAQWLAKGDIKSYTKGPVPWEKPGLKPGEDPEEQIPGAIDFNLLQRVVFRLVQRYKSDLMLKIWNDPAVQSSFVDDLADARAPSFVLKLARLNRMSHIALVRQYQQAARAQIKYLGDETIQRTLKSKFLPSDVKKGDLAALKNALIEWNDKTPPGQHTDKRETVRLMLSRITYLEGELDLIDRTSDTKALEKQLRGEEESVTRKFGALSEVPGWELRPFLKEVNHPPLGWDTNLILTTAGANAVGRTLEAIHLRLRHETIDGQAVLFDKDGFTGEFRFPIHNIGGFPAVLHRYRLVYADKLVCEYYLLRIDQRAYYGMIVRETDVWYAAVIPE